MTDTDSFAPDPTAPAVFHATHWKAGSQWVRAVLRSAQPQRMAGTRDEDMRAHVLERDLVPGAIYSPVYLARPALLERVEELPERRCFFVLRDLRDTLVSWYFSLAKSHSASEVILAWRQELAEMTVPEGLVWCLDKFRNMVGLQASWLEGDDLLVRYEDLIADEEAQFARIFAYCGIELGDAERARVVARHSFVQVSGREPGTEEVESHQRKGVAGDWQNHFDDRVKDAFKREFNQTLVAAGYVSDDAW